MIYRCVITMWIVFICYLFLATSSGFLLDPDHTSIPAGKNQCLPLGKYLSEKEDLLHHIDQLQRDNEQKMYILTSQLKSRLSAFEGKISENDRKNETLEMASLENKYQELVVNHTLLQTEYKLLRDKYSYQESEMIRLQHTTAEILKNISELQQLKTINQALDLRSIQNKVQSLEQKSNLLTNNQNARNQDFLALYNVTQVSNKHFEELQHSFRNHLQTFETNRNETLVNMIKIESKQNASSFDIQRTVSKIKTMEAQIANNSKKVAITACVSSTQQFSNYVVRFSDVISHVGIDNLDIFISSGKFVCEIPGLYYISAYIYTASPSYAFYLKKNSVNVASSASNSGSSTTSIPISAVVELQLKDTLYMDAVLTIQGSHSCLSIIKVK